MPSTDPKCRAAGFKLVYSPPVPEDAITKVLPGKVGPLAAKPKFSHTEDSTTVVIKRDKSKGSDSLFITDDFFKVENVIPEVTKLRDSSVLFKDLLQDDVSNIQNTPQCFFDKMLQDMVSFDLLDKPEALLPEKLCFRGIAFFLTYDGHFKLELVLEFIRSKLVSKDPDSSIKFYFLINERSILLYDHCHVFILLHERLCSRITEPSFFNIPNEYGIIIHPNIIVKPIVTSNTPRNVAFYLWKPDHSVPLHNIDEAFGDGTELKWKSEMTGIPSIRNRLSKMTIDEIKFAKKFLDENKGYKNSKLTIKHVAFIEKQFKSLKREISPFPKDLDVPVPIKKILSWNSKTKNSILNVFVNSRFDIENYIRLLYEHTPNMAKCHLAVGIAHSIEQYNKENSDPKVDTLLMSNTDITDSSFIEAVHNIRNSSFKLVGRKKTTELNYCPSMNIIVFNTRMINSPFSVNYPIFNSLAFMLIDYKLEIFRRIAPSEKLKSEHEKRLFNLKKQYEDDIKILDRKDHSKLRTAYTKSVKDEKIDFDIQARNESKVIYESISLDVITSASIREFIEKGSTHTGLVNKNIILQMVLNR